MGYYYYDSSNIGGGGRRGGFLSRFPVVTKNILIINVFMYIFTALRPDFMYETFSLFYPVAPGGEISPLFRFWQPLTHMFMHGGMTHLFFNMFTFVMFGATLERQWGPKKFLLFYLLTGLGAAALHLGVIGLEMNHYMDLYYSAETRAEKFWAAQSAKELCQIPMVGASGAIYGILMGYAMLYPDSVITMLIPPISLKAKWWIVIMLVIELAIGVLGTGGSVAHFAHLGGMLIGFVMIQIWKKKGTMYDYED